VKKSKFLFVLLFLASLVYGQPGKDGVKIIAGNIIVNKYSPVTSNLTSGTTSITVVSQITLLGLCPGDLIMVYQAQGATISTANTINYGNVTSYNSAGIYEYVYVNSVSGNTISLQSGLLNNYTVNGKIQVIKVPQYTSLILNTGTSVISKLWKDTIVSSVLYRFGGVIAIHAFDINNNGTIQANGAGFRGGKLDVLNQAAYTSSVTNYVSNLNYFGGEKGEGIAGYQPEYDLLNGRYGRGAPANGGGGGNAWNAGGGGGSNANNGNAWTGQGVMIVDPSNPLSAWQLDPAYIANGNALTTSSGGGRGGYSVGFINQNATITGPNNPAWGLDGRSQMGGLGGRPLPNINYTDRIYFGGGGGAGDENNANSSNGGNGGGIIYVIATNSISGNGTISANGDNGGNTIGLGYDAPSGAGAGGSIIILTPVIATTQTVTAKGGNGGNQFISNSEFEGPGGGGCGGFVAVSSGAITPLISGGIGGNTNSSSLTEFPANGATAGANGLNVIATYSFITYSGSSIFNVTASNTIICSGSSTTLSAVGALTYTWMPGNLNGTSVTVSPTSTTVYTVTGGSGLCAATQTISITVNNSPTVTVISSPTTVCSTSGSSATLTAGGALSYTWNPGAVVSTSLVITPTVTSIFSVNGVNALGCVSTTTLSYSVTPTPTINTSSSSPAICAGSSVTLSATGASSYTWNPGALPGGTVTVSPAISTTYTVTGSNGNCTSTATIAIIVNASPTITASSSPAVICSGSSSTLTGNGAVSYTWNPGALVGQTINVTPPVSTIYTVTGANAFGCTATAITIVSVNITPTLNPIASPTAICIGGTSTLSSTGASSYTWNPGNLTGSSVTVTPLVTTTYTVVGSTSGCFDTKTVSVIVNPLPVIGASSSPTAICVGNSATLTGSGGATYTWSPGPLTGVSVTVSPLVNTTYTVVGTSSLGCSNSGTVSLVVNANPTITAVSNPTSICSGSGASATLTAGGAVSYTWNPGAIVGSPVIVTPTATTIYTVTGTNASGCVSTKTVSILITPSPTITINGNPAPLCRGSSSTLTANGASSYTWLPGGSTATSIVVSPTATTVYTVIGVSGNCSSSKTFTLVVLPRPNININTIPPVICSGGSALLLAFGASSYTWNPSSSVGNTLVVSPSVTTSYTVTGSNLVGCTNTAVTTVSVNPSPTITTVPSSTLACSGSSVTLVSSGGLTYLVNPGALTGPIVVVSPSVTTTYTITGINNFGCTDTDTVTITVGNNPSITATASGSLLCDGGSFTLSASGATNYTWMPISLTGSSVVTTATNSINTYTVIGENGGCSSVATVSVFVISCNNTMFGMTKAAGKPVLVYNSFYNVDFTVTAVNASTINLTNVTLNEDLGLAFPMPSNFSVVSQPVITSQNSSLSINPLFDGVSQISLTSPSTSTLIANKRDTIVFTVRIDPKGFYGPFKNWVIGYANFINNVTVMDTSNNGFTWDPDFDGDPTNNDTVTIINLPIIDLFIPDGFSPDGDGKNDFFFIKGLNGRPVKLTIFNRWGNKVYEKSEYDNSWDGLVNATGLVLGSNKVPPATYYYIIEFLDGDKETRTGFVVVQY
jgi:gliding motility-associated-like protein